MFDKWDKGWKDSFFNLYTNDIESKFFLLNLKNGEYFEIGKDLKGFYQYPPKFIDNFRILFTLTTYERLDNLYIYDLEKKELKRLLPNLKTNLIIPIYVEKDKAYILISPILEEKISVYVLNLINEETQDITKDLNGEILNPIISNDGEIMIFRYGEVGRLDIYSMDLRTREVKNLTQDLNGECSFPLFTSDQKKIIFRLTPYKSSSSKLIIRDRDGENKKDVTDGLSNEFYFVGDLLDKIFVMLMRNKEKNFSLYSLTFNRKNLTKISDESEGGFNGKFYISNDKRKIIYGTYNENLKKEFFFLCDLNGKNKINLNEKLNLDIDSLLFLP